jgi:GNAT superfamily N-acetyltransferase
VDEVTELNRLSGRAFGAMTAEAPGFELRLTRDCAMGLSGENVADLNMLFLGPDPEAERFLTNSVARASERELPLLAAMTPHVAAELGPVAERLGLASAGTLPLMVLRHAATVRSEPRCTVERAIGEMAVRAVGNLVAAAFDLPRAAVANSLDASLTTTAGAEAYLGLIGETPMSAVTVTRAGSTAGIWCMATPPQHQGKGMGRALLTRVIEQFRRDGVERFYLAATPAGQPLYESIGFETLADYAVWVLGASADALA